MCEFCSLWLPPPIPLTPRQTEVLVGIASGLSTKEIALKMMISPKTAESHKAALQEKLGIQGIANLTRYAIRHGIA